ncbi:MAG TPA: hypothetical protein VER36_12610 [Flavisolibacter sp.]|nr:hypothetical protein [Flavisolibacter sp.]
MKTLVRFFFVPIFMLPLFVSAQPSQKNKGRIKYSAAAQREFLPEILDGVFLGMTRGELTNKFAAAELSYEDDIYDSVSKLVKHFPPGSSIGELMSATFFFQLGDTAYDAASLPPHYRLFRIVLEFASKDCRAFISRFKTSRAVKGGLTRDGWKWVLKTADGAEWMVTCRDEVFVTITGKIHGTPWKKMTN